MKANQLIGIGLLSGILVVILLLMYTSVIDIWTGGALLGILLLFGFMFYRFEHGMFSSKEISIIAILSSVSTVIRVPFAAIPSVQPSTFLIICTGYVFGPTAGFITGAITALASNMVLGQGPWTIFQMLGWGLVGGIAGLLPRLRIKNTGLLIYGIGSGFVFGWILNLWHWLSYIYPHTMTSLLFTMGSSFWFDSVHAVANAVFLLFFGEKTIQILKRYRDRFHVTFVSSSKTDPLIS